MLSYEMSSSASVPIFEKRENSVLASFAYFLALSHYTPNTSATVSMCQTTRQTQNNASDATVKVCSGDFLSNGYRRFLSMRRPTRFAGEQCGKRETGAR